MEAQVENISVLRDDEEAIVSKVEAGPLMLMKNGNPKLVLLAPEQWDEINRRLILSEAIQEARIIRERVRADRSTMVSSAEMRKRMAKRGVYVER